MKFSVVNLGCKVNRAESDSIIAHFLAVGGSEVPEEEADLIIVNTCTVTGEAEKKTRKAVSRALRINGHARVVVTGCAVAIDSAVFESMSERVQTVLKHRLLNTLFQQTDDIPAALRVGSAFRTRVSIKIQDGCNHACTYCIVHVARGDTWSCPVQKIVDEAVAYTRAGVLEIVLTGINLGSYESENLHLSQLLKRLLHETAKAREQEEILPRFRISSIEPIDFNEELIELLVSSEGRICRHVHLPLQSGSSKVLHEMARPYDMQEFYDLVSRLRSAVPKLSLSTDVIVGFPGETDEDFEATLHAVRRCSFSKVHVFPYSRREGTPAAARRDQVPSEVKAARARQLRALAEELRAAEWDARIGSVEQVLVEKNNHATTESYFDIEAPRGTLPGTLVETLLC